MKCNNVLPNAKHISDNRFIPTFIPLTTEVVAVAVMHQMMIIWLFSDNSMFLFRRYRPLLS